MKKVFIIILFISSWVYSQTEPNIKPYLEKIKKGDIEEIKKSLPELKDLYPDSKGLVLIEAMITEDGNRAQELYDEILDSVYSNPEYYKEAYYKLFQFHYATGNYSSSDKYARLLISNFPDSDYSRFLKKESEIKAEIKKEKEETLKKEPAPIPQIKETVKKKFEDKKPKGKFSIQLGVFLEKKNAVNLQNSLSSKGNLFLIEEEKSQKKFYKLLFGDFPDKPKAKAALDKLSKEQGIKGVIITLE